MSTATEKQNPHVPVSTLNTTHFRNYRTTMDRKELAELRESIRENGLGQPVAVMTLKEGKEYAVIAGYRRAEACTQLAVEDLVAEFNQSFGLSAKSAEFVHFDLPEERQRILESGDEWKKKYLEALENYDIAVFVRDDIKNEYDAALANLTENEQRDNPPLSDLLERVSEMAEAKDDNGKKLFSGKSIATAIKKSEGFVSQIKSVNRLVTNYKELFEKAIESLDEPDNVKQLLMKQWCSAMEEVIRRTKLQREDPESIQFRSLRAFSSAFMHRKDPLKPKTALDLACKLAMFNSNGKPTHNPSLDVPVFEELIRGAKLEDKADEEIQAPPEPETDQVAEVAEDQESSQQVEIDSEVPEDIEKEIDDELSVVDESSAEEESPEVDESAVVEEDDEDIVPVQQPIEEAEPVEEEAGKMKTKTVAPDDSKYKMKQPANLHEMARSRFEDAMHPNWEDPDTPVSDRLQAIAAATELFDTIGLSEKASEANDICINASDAFTELYNFMYETLNKKAKGETLKKLRKLEANLALAFGCEITDESESSDG